MASSNREYKNTLAAYKDCFSSPNGQLVLSDLRKNMMDRSSYAKGDSHQTAYNEGRRSVFLDIIAVMAQADELERKGKHAGTTATDADESDTDAADSESE